MCALLECIISLRGYNILPSPLKLFVNTPGICSQKAFRQLSADARAALEDADVRLYIHDVRLPLNTDVDAMMRILTLPVPNKADGDGISVLKV